MMKQIIIAVLALTMVVGATSCKKKTLRGEGAQISEIRQLSRFSKIETNGSEYITVVKDDDYKVILTGYSSLIPQYETDVRGERLILEYEDNFWNVKNNNIKVEVHTPYVEDVVLNGSGNIYVSSGFDQLNFDAEINGSGDITLGHNFYESMNLTVVGSGNIDAENTEALYATTRISGSGNIYAWVIEFLMVDISGSGNVYYRGNPDTDIHISGSGNVRRQN